MSYKTNMWFSGEGQKESKYYIKKVEVKTTPKGTKLTEFLVNLYDKESRDGTNYKITAWGEIKANENDFIKVKKANQIGCNTFTNDKGITYVTVTLTCNNDDIEIFSNNKESQPRESQATILPPLESDFGEDLPF